MNYRLIVRYEDTGVVTIQQFADLRTIYTIIGYLDNTVENGARLTYEIQQRSYFRGIETIDHYGDKFRRTVLVKDFTKNLDDIRLKNIFLDIFRNLVYNLDILKGRFLKWLLSLCCVFCPLGLRVLVCPLWVRIRS